MFYLQNRTWHISCELLPKESMEENESNLIQELGIIDIRIVKME